MHRSYAHPAMDPELDFVGGPSFVILLSFSCGHFLNTVVCYRKYYRLGGAMTMWSPWIRPCVHPIISMHEIVYLSLPIQ